MDLIPVSGPNTSFDPTPRHRCDLATMIFVLSAIHPQRMVAAVHNVARCLRPGSGRLLFRDYAEGDLAQERLAGGDRPKRLGPNFYVRGDGTRCYYFSQEEVLSLFASAGLVCDSLHMHERTVVNHKRDIAMDRRWLQAIFTLRKPRPPPLPLEVLLAQPPPLHQGAAKPPAQQAPQQQQQLSAASAGSSGGGASQMDVDMDAEPTPAPAPATAAAGSFGAASGAAGVNGCVSQGGSGEGNASASDGGAGGSGNGGLLLGGSWLTGAAGRLVSHLAAGPGHPSGRAMLPDSLDPADALVAELSPSPRHHHSQQAQPHGHAESHLSPEGREQRPGGFRRAHDAIVGCGGGAEGGDMQVDGAGAADSGYSGSGAGSALGGRADLCSGGGEVGGTARRGGQELERQLEAEFFATIGRNTDEVVAEEVAAAGAALSRVRLADVADLAAVRLAAAAATAAAAAPAAVSGAPLCGAGAAPSTSASGAPGQAQRAQVPPPPSLTRQCQQELLPQAEVEVPLVAGVSFRCLCGIAPSTGAPHVPPATLALARVLLASPRFLSGRCALQLGPAAPPSPLQAHGSAGAARAGYLVAPGGHATLVSTAAAQPPPAAVLPAMAAVRSSARRVVVAEAGREALATAAADLRRNAHRLVIERLKLVALDWTATADAAGAAAAATGAAGYTYVSGARRQLRDVLHLQPAGFDLVYAADPLAELTAAAAAGGGMGGAAAGEATIAAARCLFDVATQLLQPSSAVRSATQQAGSDALAVVVAGAPRGGRLLLLSFPADWAAAHGMGFAALAGVCGWELLVPEQLEAEYGVDAAAAATSGCAAMGFRRRAVH
ncbi:hypothetical protein GPECTOR_53g152 [Gonium pectorale]|uniref:Uncharacterized protein n=1 Tax=Gonium pectorale TaxID=33097 RepID=A0A150G6R7_GONPE|nr:hypothetical protein GPECTOR_53g152 [Gonium pectorale]|eukprot:KXZ45566.1 hypothetical protein GPECTOR_53g152 [Gonium pectorale]